MGTTIKRRATFTVETIKHKRAFTPVNKRAKAFAVLTNKPKLDSRDLRAIKTLGFRVSESVTLKAITV